MDKYPNFINKMFPGFTGYANGGEANKHILDYLMKIVNKQSYNKEDLVGCISDRNILKSSGVESGVRFTTFINNKYLEILFHFDTDAKLSSYLYWVAGKPVLPT